MERYMYQDDSFERLLKQKADEYRMYPSDDSWNKIQQKLRSNNNNFNWKGAAFLTTIFISLSLYVSIHQDHLAISKNITATSAVENKTNSVSLSKASTPFLGAKKKKNIKTASTTIYQTLPNKVSAETILVTETKTISTSPDFISKEATDAGLEKEQIAIELTMTDQSYRLSSLVPDIAPLNIAQQQSSIVAVESKAPIVVDENKTDADLNYEVNVPVTIKSKPATQIQFYATPSVSYRVLISDNKFIFGNFQQNVESAVSQSSSVGFEVGAAIMFPISNRLKFRTGLQLNRTQYIVTASKFAQEQAIVSLNAAPTTQRTTNLRTSNGYFPEDIVNTTFQISIPLGLEFRLAGTQKLSWHLGAGVQPTYQLHATGYLVTGDLKNYIKAPDLLSKMNLNSSLETFFRWGNKKFELQAGPQLRYQLFSNSKGKYPVQEHLVDYGFKIGFIKSLQ